MSSREAKRNRGTGRGAFIQAGAFIGINMEIYLQRFILTSPFLHCNFQCFFGHVKLGLHILQFYIKFL